jgi:hypothetical protein
MAKSDNALICEKRGFVVGDVIEGAEDGHIARLKIIFIGHEVVVFNELKNVEGIWRFYEETAGWTLNARDWRVVEHINTDNQKLIKRYRAKADDYGLDDELRAVYKQVLNDLMVLEV